MAKLTNAQLLSELTTLRAHCNHVETERDSLRTEVAALKAQLAAATSAAPRTQRAVYVRPYSVELEARHAAYVRALLASKEQAMRTGLSVRVKPIS